MTTCLLSNNDFLTDQSTLVQIKNATAAFGMTPVLKAIDWHWKKDERWAVVGDNGAGKTALAYLLTRRLRAQRGSVHWHESIAPQQDIIHVDFEWQRQFIAHDDRFDDSEWRDDAFDVGTTVKQLILQGKPATNNFTTWATQWGLAPILERGIRFISTGESRKALLARALYAKPKLLIIDNPFAGLDQAMRHQLRDLLNQLLLSDLPMVLLLQHIHDLPENIDHLLWLEQGAVRDSGSRDAVLPVMRKNIMRNDQHVRILPAPLPRPYSINHHKPLLQLKQVNVSYGGVPILTDIHWRMDWGQHSCIMGPNGAGKSTLLNLLCGNNHQAYGQPIDLFGRRKGSGESIWEIKQKFGVVNNALHLEHPQHIRVVETIAAGIYDTIGLYQTCSDVAKQLTLAWLKILGLEDMAKQPFGRLSFGQQRLVLLARAMVKSPLILILDEPCMGLDAQHCELLLSLVDAITHSGQSHVLYVSHDIGQQPACINQWVTLQPHEAGGFTAMVSQGKPRTEG